VSRAAVFLDRDGTLNHERGYIDRLEMLELFPWAADSVRLLQRGGFATVVITNQAAVGRGLIDEPFLASVHGRMSDMLARGSASIDRYYHCPHLPDADLAEFRAVCECRKPRPGMILRACQDLDIDPSRSFMVGDRWLDVQCGASAGVRTVLLRTGHGAREADAAPEGVRADAILNNLMEAAGWILRNSSR
jgi:D-glycero-D-manno-heptose 1,7-bisphosphate phosphatase